MSFWCEKGSKIMWSCCFFRYLNFSSCCTCVSAFLGNKESLVHEQKNNCRSTALRMSSTLLESLIAAQSCDERCVEGRGVVVVLWGLNRGKKEARGVLFLCVSGDTFESG